MKISFYHYLNDIELLIVGFAEKGRHENKNQNVPGLKGVLDKARKVIRWNHFRVRLRVIAESRAAIYHIYNEPNKICLGFSVLFFQKGIIQRRHTLFATFSAIMTFASFETEIMAITSNLMKTGTLHFFSKYSPYPYFSGQQ